ncbi:MAG: hypothetical protein ACXW1T_05825 [Methylophilus sp.]
MIDNPLLYVLINEVRERINQAGNPPTYLTIDIDCLDHAELTSNAAATFVWTYLCGPISAKNKLKSQ